METIAVPDVAQQRLRALYTAYVLSRQDLVMFVNGLLLGMGLCPDDWELDTSTMTLTKTPGIDGTAYQRVVHSNGA